MHADDLGRPVTMATSMIGYDDVLVAMMASGPRMPSSSVKIAFLRSRFSERLDDQITRGEIGHVGGPGDVGHGGIASGLVELSSPTAFAIDPSTLP